MKRYIVVRNEVEFVHRYLEAPSTVIHLRNYHRHIAHIETEIEVYHDDRELEFIIVKNSINSAFNRNKIEMLYVDKSCEMVAQEVIEHVVREFGNRAITCKVFEDGENGAKIVHNPRTRMVRDSLGHLIREEITE